jgi:glutamate-1-semialdehyde aminotransferase/spore coat polysaccharide biosynthesis protein SpsF (cytidylyltransferase family)
MRKKVVAIVQARLDSTRLPGKVLKPLQGRPLLSHVVSRLQESKMINKVIVATSNEDSDIPIAEFCAHNEVSCFRGSKNDVLDRFYHAAKLFDAEVIVRITGDCPLIDPQVTDRVIKCYLTGDSDYVSNIHPPTFPDGLDTEVFSFSVLERAWKEATMKYQKEHVTPYIVTSDKFTKMNVTHNTDLSHLRWCVDYEEDFIFVENVLRGLNASGNDSDFLTLISFLDENPHLSSGNVAFTRNEGFLKSLQSEGVSPEKYADFFSNGMTHTYTNIMNKNNSNGGLPMGERKLTKSFELWEKGKKLIPCGTQTASKGPDQFVHGVYPIYLQSGQGSHVFDVDGNEYIDYPCSLGSNFLGHNYPVVSEAIARQAKEGINFSLMHPLEVEMAELLTNAIPCAEQVKFCKNGSDATSGAVRIARAFTGRDKIVFCGYHGWQDWYVRSTGKKKGVPAVLDDYIFRFHYNDIDSLQKIFDVHPGEIACIIMEPVITEAPQAWFLEKVREIATQNGAVLIFDEMVTGFRFGLGGAQKYFNVIPDVACFGKSVANGMPLSIIAGKNEVMNECHEIFFSTTFGGEAVSLAAGVATIKEMQQKDVVDHIWKVGKMFNEGFNKIAQEIGIDVSCVGLPPRQNLVFKDATGNVSQEMKSLFLQETIKKHILIGNIIFFSYSHTEEDIRKTLDACREALVVLKQGVDQGNISSLLEGQMAAEVFRQKSQ